MPAGGFEAIPISRNLTPVTVLSGEDFRYRPPRRRVTRPYNCSLLRNIGIRRSLRIRALAADGRKIRDLINGNALDIGVLSRSQVGRRLQYLPRHSPQSRISLHSTGQRTLLLGTPDQASLSRPPHILRNMSSSKTHVLWWPRADSAEDQQYARTILTTHVVYRGFQSGVAVSLIFSGARATYSRFRRGTATSPQSKTTPGIPPSPSSTAKMPSTAANASPATVASKALRSAGRAGLVTSLAMGAALPFYVSSVAAGKDKADVDYAWRDRAYRLLHNEGQVSVDRWSLSGMLVGGASTVVVGVPGGPVGPALLVLLGRVGVGSLGGVVGSGVYRGLTA